MTCWCKDERHVTLAAKKAPPGLGIMKRSATALWGRQRGACWTLLCVSGVVFKYEATKMRRPEERAPSRCHRMSGSLAPSTIPLALLLTALAFTEVGAFVDKSPRLLSSAASEGQRVRERTLRYDTPQVRVCAR
jgi:hypothetical protein